MPEEHALLSASGSKRWLMCPPSARLEEKFEETSSIYADEGTFGHSLAEFKLRCFIEVKSKSTRDSEYQQLSQHKYYSKELEDAVDFYVDVVKEQLAAAQAKDPGAILLLEQKLDLSAYAPESFGTGDAVIVTEDEVIVMDLKMGKGVKVEGADNSQMRLYGLGALDAYRCMYELTQVTTIVVQPRLDNVSGETMTAAELALWGESIKPLAIIPKTNTVLVNKVKAGIKEAAQKGIDILGGKIPVNLKSPLRDGDNDPPGGNPRPELMGMYYITSSTLDQPLVVDRNRQVIINPTELYSGCYGFVSMNLKAYNHKTGGKGIGAYLNGVQKARDGEPLGFVKESAEEMFEELEPASDSGSLLD